MLALDQVSETSEGDLGQLMSDFLKACSALCQTVVAKDLKPT